MSRVLLAFAGTEEKQEEIAQALRDKAALEREAALAAAKEIYPDLDIVADNLQERAQIALEYLNSYYQMLMADGRESVTHAELAEAIGLSTTGDEDPLLVFLRDDVNLGHEIAVAILLNLGVEEEEEPQETDRFVVFPDAGHWTAGHRYQVEILDTASVRFVKDGEPTAETVVYSNFNIYQEDFNNLRLRDSILWIPVEQMEGVEMGKSLISIDTDEEDASDADADDEDAIQELVYSGQEVFKPGDLVAVYDGEMTEDILDFTGDITYIKIASDLGEGHYTYGGVDLMDVLALPDAILLPDDGSFDDGVIVVDASALDFSDPMYEKIRLNADTVVDADDILVLYGGDLAACLDTMDENLLKPQGYARITSVEEADGKVTIRYTATTLQEIQDSFFVFHSQKNDADQSGGRRSRAAGSHAEPADHGKRL